MKRKLSTSHSSFLFYDRASWSTDSDDEDYVHVQEKKRKRSTDKKQKLTRNGSIGYHNQIEKSSIKDCLNYWGECIPVEVLYLIFKYVFVSDNSILAQKSISRVCKLWQSVSFIPSLWIKVDLSTVKAKKEKVFTEFFQNRLPSLSSVNLSGWSKLKSTSWELMTTNCPKLQSIDLTGTKVNGESLLLIARECSLLTSITLSNIEVLKLFLRFQFNCDEKIDQECFMDKHLFVIDDLQTNAISQGVMIQFFEALNIRLKSFSFSHCFVNGFSNILKAILATCPNIELFELSGIKSRSTPNISVEQLQRSWKNLRVLRLTNSYFNCIAGPCGPGFPELKELSLCNLKNLLVKNEFISNLVSMSEKLKLLDLRHISQLDLPKASYLHVRDVSHLYLSKLNGCHITMGDMLQKWRQSLIELDLSEINWSGDEFQLLMEVIINQSLPLLRNLSLRAAPATSRHILCIIDSCPNLRELDLTQCRALPRGTKKLHSDGSFYDLVLTLKKMPV